MLTKIKEWIKDNKDKIFLALSISLAIGIGIALFACFVPTFFVAVTGFSIWGIAPFAFLTQLSLPLATLALGSILSGMSLLLFPVVGFISNQLITIGFHLHGLMNREEEAVGGPSLYQNKYLQPNTENVYGLECDEFEDPLARFHVPTQPLSMYYSKIQLKPVVIDNDSVEKEVQSTAVSNALSCDRNY